MTEHGPHGVEPPHPHVLPLALYWGVLAALLVLTAITVVSAQVNLGPFNLPLAMLIATTKAGLVLAIFMHLYFDNKLNLVVFISSLLFLSIFIVVTMLDTEGRGLVDPTRENFTQRNAAVQKAREEAKAKDVTLRPGEPFGVTTGRENFESHKPAHAAPAAGH
jgi:cytochrome c oxidase subunit IV